MKDCLHCSGHTDDFPYRMGFSLFLWTVKLSIFRFLDLCWEFCLFVHLFFKWANVNVTVIERNRLCVL